MSWTDYKKEAPKEAGWYLVKFSDDTTAEAPFVSNRVGVLTWLIEEPLQVTAWKTRG